MSPHIPPSEIELRRIRSAVEDGAETLDAIGKRFGRSRKTIVGYVARYGWSNERIAAQRGHAAIKTKLAIKRGHKANERRLIFHERTNQARIHERYHSQAEAELPAIPRDVRAR